MKLLSISQLDAYNIKRCRKMMCRWGNPSHRVIISLHYTFCEFAFKWVYSLSSSGLKSVCVFEMRDRSHKMWNNVGEWFKYDHFISLLSYVILPCIEVRKYSCFVFDLFQSIKDTLLEETFWVLLVIFGIELCTGCRNFLQMNFKGRNFYTEGSTLWDHPLMKFQFQF